MKQIVLAVIALFLVVSMYAVYKELNKIIPFTDQNCTQAQSDTATSRSDSKSSAKKEKTAKKTYVATPESKRLFLKKTIAAIRKVKARLDAEYQAVYELSLK